MRFIIYCLIKHNTIYYLKIKLHYDIIILKIEYIIRNKNNVCIAEISFLLTSRAR